eukprot:TRINITY_DN9919_c0_g1_i1.p1 TRINITY_DN9919_c0_g1~~TRINITY_DN9919_c0_g1_i1.p1  ORF type:complete len:271 (-),score=33.13 TRINITY_DN9919_c0_g1_i1:25-837(-)
MEQMGAGGEQPEGLVAGLSQPLLVLVLEQLAGSAHCPTLERSVWAVRNQLLNLAALVCRQWHETVAPWDGSYLPDALHRCVSVSNEMSGRFQAWWTVVRVAPSMRGRSLARLAAASRDRLLGLSLEECDSLLSGEDVVSALLYCTNLTHLSLGRTSSEGLIRIVQRCGQLDWLSLLRTNPYVESGYVASGHDHLPEWLAWNTGVMRIAFEKAIEMLPGSCTVVPPHECLDTSRMMMNGWQVDESRMLKVEERLNRPQDEAIGTSGLFDDY